MISGDSSRIRNFVYNTNTGRVEEIHKPGDKSEYSNEPYDPKTVVIDVPFEECKAATDTQIYDVNFETITYNSKGKIIHNKKITKHIGTI